MNKIYVIAFGLAAFALSSCGEAKSYNPLLPITGGSDVLHARENVKLSTLSEDVTWSVSNDLATIDQEGNLKVGEKDGSFYVTLQSNKDPSCRVNRLFKVKTMKVDELSDFVYKTALGQDYTLCWSGKFLHQDGSEVTKAEVKKDDPDPMALSIYEDMAEKGNLVKYTPDAFYCRYGMDGYGNSYEGGSYNSPDNGGLVYDYNVVNGKVEKGNADYFSAMLGIPKYQDIYTGDLRYFVRDEFKIEDAGLRLSEDGSHLVYEAKNDKNDFRDPSSLSEDYSFSTTLFGIIDSFYGMQFSEYQWDHEATGVVRYDESSLTAKFTYRQIHIGASACYDYEATLSLFDIGRTEIPGIKELIESDKAALTS